MSFLSLLRLPVDLKASLGTLNAISTIINLDVALLNLLPPSSCTPLNNYAGQM